MVISKAFLIICKLRNSNYSRIIYSKIFNVYIQLIIKFITFFLNKYIMLCLTFQVILIITRFLINFILFKLKVSYSLPTVFFYSYATFFRNYIKNIMYYEVEIILKGNIYYIRDRINLVPVVQEVIRRMIRIRKRNMNHLSQQEQAKRSGVQKDQMLL